MTSQVRFNMACIMYPHKENIIRCHTDGFISTDRINELEIGMEIGKWKVTKEGNVKISSNHIKKTDWF